MSETTPRQVLYALVGGGFLVVVTVLVVGAAAAEITPVWWTVIMSGAVAAAGLWSTRNWRRTVPVLVTAIGLFLLWAIGTLLLAR